MEVCDLNFPSPAAALLLSRCAEGIAGGGEGDPAVPDEHVLQPSHSGPVPWRASQSSKCLVRCAALLQECLVCPTSHSSSLTPTPPGHALSPSGLLVQYGSTPGQ